jgi:hypothetical protein
LLGDDESPPYRLWLEDDPYERYRLPDEDDERLRWVQSVTGVEPGATIAGRSVVQFSLGIRV